MFLEREGASLLLLLSWLALHEAVSLVWFRFLWGRSWDGAEKKPGEFDELGEEEEDDEECAMNGVERVKLEAMADCRLKS